MLSVGAVSSNLNIVAKSADYTAAANDFVMVNATAGPVTITMPASPGKNTLVAVKKADASTNMVAIVPGTGALLNGDTAAGLVAGGASVTFQYDGVDWQMVSTGAVNAANTAAGIPTGGTAGQVLAKNTASNYDAAWSTPVAAYSGVLPPWRSGRIHMPPTSTTVAIWTPVVTALQLWPVQIPNPCTIGKIGVIVSGVSNASNYRVYIYADNPAATSGGPSALIGSLAISVTATGFTQSASAWNYTFTAPTTVWVGAQADNAVNTGIYGSPAEPLSFLVGKSGPYNSGTALTNLLQSNTAYPYTTALPTDLSTVSLSANTSNRPLLGFQIA